MRLVKGNVAWDFVKLEGTVVSRYNNYYHEDWRRKENAMWGVTSAHYFKVVKTLCVSSRFLPQPEY